MDARDRRYIKEAKERAKTYAAIKRGYATPEEKKAFKIAERLRRADWMNSLAAHVCVRFGHSKRRCSSRLSSAKGTAQSARQTRRRCRRADISTQTTEERTL